MEEVDRKYSCSFGPDHKHGSSAEHVRRNFNAKLANPLVGISHAELRKKGRNFAIANDIGDGSDIRAFELSAVLAQSLERYTDVADLTGARERNLESRLYSPVVTAMANVRGHGPLLSICCYPRHGNVHLIKIDGLDETGELAKTGANGKFCVIDEAVVNGAQIWYRHQIGIADNSSRSTWLTGLVNSAPYLYCGFIGRWLTVPFNHWLGRRGTIFLACFYSAAACLWQGFVSTWWAMFVARFALGLGSGPKSATVPIYASETAPSAIRRALVMQWQIWTAFGIMLGYAADLIIYQVSGTAINDINWRMMMSSLCFLRSLFAALFLPARSLHGGIFIESSVV